MTGPNKAIASGVAGTASILVLWLIGLTGVTVPAEVAGALTALVGTLATWLMPHGGAA